MVFQKKFYLLDGFDNTAIDYRQVFQGLGHRQYIHNYSSNSHRILNRGIQQLCLPFPQLVGLNLQSFFRWLCQFLQNHMKNWYCHLVGKILNLIFLHRNPSSQKNHQMQKTFRLLYNY